jgi:hypothetical protein
MNGKALLPNFLIKRSCKIFFKVKSFRNTPSALYTFYLHFGEVTLLAGSNLTRSHEQVFLELQTHDFIFLTTITETADDLAKQFPAFQVLGINQGDAICTVNNRINSVFVISDTMSRCLPTDSILVMLSM